MSNKVRLRVFTRQPGRDGIQDHVVSLPEDVRCVDVVALAAEVLRGRLGTEQFTVTGVNLHPHWNREIHGHGTQA